MAHYHSTLVMSVEKLEGGLLTCGHCLSFSWDGVALLYPQFILLEPHYLVCGDTHSPFFLSFCTHSMFCTLLWHSCLHSTVFFLTPFSSTSSVLNQYLIPSILHFVQSKTVLYSDAAGPQLGHANLDPTTNIVECIMDVHMYSFPSQSRCSVHSLFIGQILKM